MNLEQILEMIGDTPMVLYNGWTCYMGQSNRPIDMLGCCFECCGGCESCFAVEGSGDTAKEALLNAWNALQAKNNPPAN